MSPQSAISPQPQPAAGVPPGFALTRLSGTGCARWDAVLWEGRVGACCRTGCHHSECMGCGG
eukprot:CAMPEP_0179164424 /NCGR_PEP_ID=MMETSP0796-20121207/80687_1 /TAXON_ID=73915 /ORGANISM="Pyrodinium bahamense, Strain pbaha01" /LENGTH=61 /DNA_ID=CAMNT_0020866863 /DNA_START=8 /DNA_END=189 /DNA_ORIENTATION=+